MSARLNRLSLLCLALVAAATFSRAAFAAEAAAGAGDDAAILPFLDEGTFIVARLDVDKVQPKALESFMNDVTERMIKQISPPEADQARQRASATEAFNYANKWLTGMTEAGVHRAYFLVLNAGDLNEHKDQPLVVVPLKEGMDEEKIQGLLKGNFGRDSEATKLNDALVSGTPNAIGRLRTHLDAKVVEPGVAAADLNAALAASGEAKDVPLRIAILPGEATRAWIEQNLPAIPPMLGGGETKIISRGLHWASIAISQNDKPTAHVKIQGTDADSAKALNDLILKSKEFLKTMAAASPQAEESVKVVDAIEPKLSAETVTMSLDPANLFQMRMLGHRSTAVTPAPVPAPGRAPAKADDNGL